MKCNCKTLSGIPSSAARLWSVPFDALQSARKNRLLAALPLAEWQRFHVPSSSVTGDYGEGSRAERVRWFRARLARWAKDKHGTWAAAAEALGCDEKTLRQDAALVDGVAG